MITKLLIAMVENLNHFHFRTLSTVCLKNYIFYIKKLTKHLLYVRFEFNFYLHSTFAACQQ